MGKCIAIIAVRLSSERLPNKALLQVPPGSGTSMLEMVIRKALLAKTVDEVVVVTPDKELMKICRMCGVKCYVKSFEGRDVLREFYEAARTEYADVIVRATADCPLLQPEEIDRCVGAFLEGGYDILYNTDESTGQLNGEGSDAEVLSFEVLEKAFREAPANEREHVTTFVRRTMRTRFLDGVPLGLKSVNTFKDYVDVCQMVMRPFLEEKPKRDANNNSSTCSQPYYKPAIWSGIEAM